MKNSLYEKAISILTSQGKFHISLGLERVLQLLELLDNPHAGLKIIHVAGTNGKGSTCAMLSSILTDAGYKTGLYTSPHLIEYTERLKINGKDISQNEFAELIFQIINTAEENNIPATEFELLTVAGFLYFEKQNVDYVILETGLGGRLDATNVVNPILSIITSIDFDHTDRLGNSLEEIAFEKSGIIKNKISVITPFDNNGLDVIKNTASEKQSELILADYSKYIINQNIIKTDDNEYEVSLLGLWQTQNLCLVLNAVKVLNQNGLNVTESNVKNGLKTTKWNGRLQFIKEKSIILDGAHNLSGAKLLLESLNYYFPNKKRIWIYSSLSTKDYNSIIEILFSPEDIVICTKSNSNAAVLPEILSEKIKNKKQSNAVYHKSNLIDAINLSNDLLTSEHIIIIAGSLYTVGETLNCINI